MSKEWWDAERQAWFDISKEPPPSTVEGRPKVVLVTENFKLVVASMINFQAAFRSWLRAVVMASWSGFRWTVWMRVQLRVAPFQRSG